MGGKVERICVHCGTTFFVFPSAIKPGEALYCSKRCLYVAKSKRVLAHCETCDKEFETVPSAINRGGGKFCSVECRARSKDTHIEKICAQCGNTFRARRAESEQGRARYCSDKCRSDAHRKRRVFQCGQCGNDVDVPQCRNEMKFCSYECLEEWRQIAQRRASECKKCGKAFTVVANRIKEGRGKFCSHKCYLEYKGETSIERLIREELNLHPELEYQPQVRIGRYRVDFLIVNRNCVIECDGNYWHKFVQVILRDRKKDEYFKSMGYRVFRFTESEIRKAAGDCVDRILRA